MQYRFTNRIKILHCFIKRMSECLLIAFLLLVPFDSPAKNGIFFVPVTSPPRPQTRNNISPKLRIVAANNFKDFVAAVEAQGSKTVILVISTPMMVPSNFSVPSTIQLRFKAKGLLKIVSGVTLNMSCPKVPPQQIFSGAGSVLFSDKGKVFPEWWGGKGDGITDSAPSIDAASRSLSRFGGTVVLQKGGTYLLGTLSSDANAYYSYVTAYDKVDIRGKAVLKVKSGENAKFFSQNAPNIIATRKATPLSNCRYSDFSVDWNGADNLLTKEMKVRNNATILTIHGAENLLIDHIKVKNTPGDQVIFIKNESYATNPGKNVVIKESLFTDNGSAVPNNYNNDHSSIYVMADDVVIERNKFFATRTVNGSAYELHGSRNKAAGNKINYYGNGFYIASDVKNISDITVDGEYIENCNRAFGISAPRFAVDSVVVKNSEFRQKKDLLLSKLTYFVNGYTVSSCSRLEISGCKFIGNGNENNYFLQHYKERDFVFNYNFVSNFVGGIYASGIDIGSGLYADNIDISNNIFENVSRAIYFGNIALSFKTINITNNVFKSSVPRPVAIKIDAKSGKGIVAGNVADKRYSNLTDIRLSGTAVITEKFRGN